MYILKAKYSNKIIELEKKYLEAIDEVAEAIVIIKETIGAIT